LTHQLLSRLRVQFRVNRQHLLALDERFDRCGAGEWNVRDPAGHERGDLTAALNHLKALRKTSSEVPAIRTSAHTSTTFRHHTARR
jgi:hypothetical protein